MSLVKAVSTIAGFTLLSRIFGFVREMLVANYLGAGVASDAFFVAFKLPNFLRRFFAEGAFNAGFVPLFAGMMEEKGEEAARQFSEEVFSALALVLLVIVALAEIFMPAVVLAFAPGFDADAEKFALAVTLSRLCFPYIFFISLLTLYSGILNSMHRFAAAAAAPILLNLCMIASLLISPQFTSPAHALSTGVLVAGFVQFLWMGWACQKAGMLPHLRRPRVTPQVKRLLKLCVPAAFGASIAQINLLIDVILASLFPGAVSWLYYADRLNELVIGVIGVAISTALLPMLSRAIKAGEMETALTRLNQATFFCLVLAFPAAVALCVIAEPLIATLFQHGEFTAADTAAVYPALMAFAAGLPAFVMIKVLAPGFYAREDTMTPVKIGIVCVALNLACNLVLMQFLQHVGLALSTTISGWVNALAMGMILLKRGHFAPDVRLKKQILHMILASLLMCAVLILGQGVLSWEGTREEIISLALLILAGGGTYLLAIWFADVITWAEVKQLRRRGKST
jgi:putative peptidoglycan lipid II flippase